MNAVDLPAGPALDALVAERVLGHHRDCDGIWHPAHASGLQSPVALESYSADLKAAWTIVERLRDAGYAVRVQELPDTARRSVCLVERSVLGVHARVGTGSADDAALAICRAALAAAGEPGSRAATPSLLAPGRRCEAR